MTRTRSFSAQGGFTLVEIAIVLVIIGLLLGGVLKGQEMITQARIKNVMNDLNGVSSAYFAYQDRYKQIPGDDNQALTRWPAPIAAPNGNGNGILEGAYDATAAGTAESTLFWWHLRAAGFIPGATQTAGIADKQPSNALSGKIGATTDSTTTGTIGLSGIIVCSQHLPDKIAGAVDIQMDDGNPNTGNLRGLVEGATLGTLPLAAPAASGSTIYPETGTSNYVICRQI
jgi:prepilin-type N-terminal cleavage/methylation domain-containing protein